jgi:hypothetical protein
MSAPVDPTGRVAALIAAHAKYPSPKSGSFYDEVLVEVQERAVESGSLGKTDIGALMFWKRLNLSTGWTRELNTWDDSKVRDVTGAALELARNTSQVIPEAAGVARVALLELPGCRQGAAVASTLLTAGAPDRMAVYDRRAVDPLRALGYPHPNGRYSRFMANVFELVELVNVTTGVEWRPRDVDKALFMMGMRDGGP